MTPLLADVTAWWLQCGLLLSAGILFPFALRLRDPGVRLRLGQVLLCAALVLPVLQPRRESPPGGTGIVSFISPASATTDAVGWRFPFDAAVLAVIVGGALLRTSYLAVGILRLRKLRARATPFEEVPVPIRTAAARANAQVQVLVSPDLSSPITVGIRRPVVLVPTDFAALPPLEQEAIACHEFLHVTRKDGWTILIEELVRAVLWYQPAAWAVLSRVALAREQAVDRQVVRLTGDCRTYLRALARVAQRAVAAPAGAIPFQTRSHAVERMASLAKEVSMPRNRVLFLTSLTAVLLTFVAGAGSVAFPLADDPKTAGGTIYEVGGSVSEPVEVSRVRPIYPPDLKAKGQTGSVTLNAVIDENGKVTSVEPLQPSDAAFTTAAVEAVGQWTYKPAMRNGKPVKVRLQCTVSFMLDAKPSK